MTHVENTNTWTFSTKIFAAGLLAIWAAFAYLVGSTGILHVAGTEVFRPIVVSVIIPVGIFVVGYTRSQRFRNFVLSQDIRSLTILQHWRIMGFTFLMLYAYDILPALFAWPAGFGDVAIGLAAPFMVARLDRDPAFAHSARFLIYHALGLLDFAAAVVTATLASGAFPNFLSGDITSGPMEVWPLNLFPSFLVPIFIILHLTVFLKVWALRRAPEDETNVMWRTAV